MINVLDLKFIAHLICTEFKTVELWAQKDTVITVAA